MDDTRVLPARHRLDVDDYRRMGEAAILGQDDRVELIDGELIDMAPIGQDHAGTVDALTHTLVLAFSGQAIVRVQNPLRLDRFSEPQPDIAVLRPRSDFYRRGAPPGPPDVLLVIEVADTSLNYDRGVKLPLYARAGVAEVWIVDLRRRVMEAYREPTRDGYTKMATLGPADTVFPTLMPGIGLMLHEILG